jgi:hypothetical protein
LRHIPEIHLLTHLITTGIHPDIMSPSTLKLKLILLVLSFSLPSVLTAPVPLPQIEFEVGGLVDGLTRGGLEGEKRNASPSPQGFLLGDRHVTITEEKVKRQLDFEVGGNPVGLTRGGLAGEKRDPPSGLNGDPYVPITRGGKRDASPESEKRGFVIGTTDSPIGRGGLEGEKREAAPEPVPQSYGISGGEGYGFTSGG